MAIKMYGVDVSSYQGAFNIGAQAAQGKNVDFVIAKATEGLGYTNPYCDTVIQHAIKAKKPWGFYHYFDGNGAHAEVDFFLKNTWSGYGKKGLPCFDWEFGGNAAFGNGSYLADAVNYFHSRTGVWPVIYTTAEVANGLVGTGIFKNCALWCAGYPINSGTWNVPNFIYSLNPAITMIIWQFDSAGGFDKNVSYIDAATWAKYVNPSSKVVAPVKPASETKAASKPAPKPVSKAPAKSSPAPKPKPLTAIQQFEKAGNQFTAKGTFKVDAMKQVNGIWQMINYNLAGGKNLNWTLNGIPFDIVDNLTRGNAPSKVGDTMRFNATYNHGTIDSYDPKSNGVGIKMDKYGIIWFNADALLKL